MVHKTQTWNREKNQVPRRKTLRSDNQDLELQTKNIPTDKLKPKNILTLQRIVGNKAVQQMLAATRASEAKISPQPLASLQAVAEERRVISGAAAILDPVEYKNYDSLSKIAQSKFPDEIVLGYTFDPSLSSMEKSPTFKVETEQKAGEEWTATVKKVDNADEGYADSWYTPANERLKVGEVDGTEICLRISPEISDLGKQAEQEHVDDHRLAYRRSLGAVDQVLTGVNGTTYGPKSSEEEAKQAARNGLEQRLEGINLKREAAKWKQEDENQYDERWMEKYQELCKLSKVRDDNQWHDFGVDQPPQVDDREKRKTYTVVKGKTQIGNHPPSELIKGGWS